MISCLTRRVDRGSQPSRSNRMIPMFKFQSIKTTLGILAFMCLMGCQGRSVGTVIEIQGQTLLILDKQ
jgi:hypothetical protein